MEMSSSTQVKDNVDAKETNDIKLVQPDLYQAFFIT